VDSPPPHPTPTTQSTTQPAVVVPVAPLPTPIVPAPDVSASANNVVAEDAHDARNSIRQTIAQGAQAVQEMMQVAKDLKTPRAYEVVGNLLKTMAELNQDLLAVHQQEMMMEDPEIAPSGNVNIGTAVFVGSTTDLQEVIRLKREESKKLVVINPPTSNVG
jgi:hypothetical protein